MLNDINAMIAKEITAAGNAMKKFSLNLSFILQPCPLQAAIVVSEINDRLSPNIEPPIIVATQRDISNPDAFETATAIGVKSVIVPTDVPIASDTKQLTIKSTITANCAGIIDSIKYATLSALPLPTTPTKMPASKNISIMVKMFLSPTPRPIISSFLSKSSFLF